MFDIYLIVWMFSVGLNYCNVLLSLCCSVYQHKGLLFHSLLNFWNYLFIGLCAMIFSTSKLPYVQD